MEVKLVILILSPKTDGKRKLLIIFVINKITNFYSVNYTSFCQILKETFYMRSFPY